MDTCRIFRKMKKGNEELEAWLSRMLSPRINFRFFEVPMDEGMVVLMEILVQKNNRYSSLAGNL